MDICLKCARFPFCEEAEANKKECKDYMKISLENLLKESEE